MRKVFLTFGDGGANFICARERISKEAARTGLFDEILAYGWGDVVDQGVLDSPLRKYSRGCGYWIWKPEIIFSVLSRLTDGDVLVFCDAGDVVFNARRQWRIFFRLLNSHDIVCKRISSCNLHMCRKEMLERFCGSSGICGRLCFQFETGTILIKRTSFTLALVKEWMTIMVQDQDIVPDVIDKSEIEKQLPTFVANRYEQSIFTLLLQKFLSDDSCSPRIRTVWEFHMGWWLGGPPCIETARLRGDGQFRFGFKAMCIRIAYRVIWRLQQFLERRGICLFWEKGGRYGA